LYLIDGSYKKVVLCDKLGLNGLSAFIISPVDQTAVWMTSNEFRILQAGLNALDHGANICVLPLFFFYFLAILETWLGIVEALPRLLVPNPTQQQKAAAPGGLVYVHISLKVERSELANEREAISKIASEWQGTCTFYLKTHLSGMLPLNPPSKLLCRCGGFSPKP
jgi:hypothetical protein